MNNALQIISRVNTCDLLDYHYGNWGANTFNLNNILYYNVLWKWAVQGYLHQSFFK